MTNSISFYTTAVVSLSLSSLNLIIHVFIFILVIIHLIIDSESSRSIGGWIRKALKVDRPALLILFVSFSGIFASLTFLLICAWSFGAKSDNKTICTTVLPKCYSTSYILGSAALYEFLNIRSEATKAASEEIRNFKYIRFITKSMSKMIPLLSIAALIFWRSEIIHEDGVEYCNDALGWEISLLFVILAVPTAFLYLLLFVWPLKYHYSKIKEAVPNSNTTATTELLLKIMRRNTILSVIAMVSTLIANGIITYFSLVQANKALYNVGAACVDTEASISLICICLMTDQWLPKSIRKYVSSSSSKDSNLVSPSPPISPAGVIILVPDHSTSSKERLYHQTTIGQPYNLSTFNNINTNDNDAKDNAATVTDALILQ